MPILNFPAPSDISAYITSSEISSRSLSYPPDQVESIFRYGAIVGSAIHSYDTLERGMDQARLLIDQCEQTGQSFASGTAIFAGQLTGGKGRFQRYWHAPEGGVWLTLVLVNTLVPEISRLLPLAAGVAACETVRHFGVMGRIKWVNDVLLEGRKVAGILVESLIGPRSGEEYVLIGAGINVNNNDFPPELEGLAACMASFCGKDLDVSEVAKVLLAKLAWNIGLLYFQEEQELAGLDGCQTGKHHFLQDQWRKLSDSAGRLVSFGYDVQQDPQYEARVIGLDDDGGLRLLHLEDGVVITEYGGEIVYL